MLNLISLQNIFHAHFELEPSNTPAFLDKEAMEFRTKAMLEELNELNEAIFQRDLSKALDALVDLQVFLLGTAHLMGFFNTARHSQILSGKLDGSYFLQENETADYTIFEEAFNRVWQANMQKELVESADESKRGYARDLKKPEGWKEPQFKDLL